jgi:hypothetical protein
MIYERNGGFGGMKIGRGNQDTWRKPSLVSACRSKIHIEQVAVAVSYVIAPGRYPVWIHNLTRVVLLAGIPQ